MEYNIFEVKSVPPKKKNQDNDFGLGLLLGTLGVMAVVLAVTFPKIYLCNQIYYKSRQVNVLLNQYAALREENEILRQKLEAIKFKNQIQDALF